MANPLEFGVVTEHRQADKLSKPWSNTSDFKLHKEQEHPLLHPPAEHLQVAAHSLLLEKNRTTFSSSSPRSQAMCFQRKLPVVRLDANQLRELPPSPQLQQECSSSRQTLVQ